MEPFYSALARNVEASPMRAAPAEGWRQYFTGLVGKGQVKLDELEWSGITDWLDLQPGKVPKDAVQQYLAENGVQLTETIFGGKPGADLPEGWQLVQSDETGVWHVLDDENAVQGEGDTREEAVENAQDESESGVGGVGTKFSKYTLPEGKNYREILLTLPKKTATVDIDGWTAKVKRAKSPITLKTEYEVFNAGGESQGTSYTADSPEDAIRALARVKAQRSTESANYKSGHWDQPNILAHIRLNDRTDADGKRVLFVEEIQSDWAQQGKKTGFQGDMPAKAAFAAFEQALRERFRQYVINEATELKPERREAWADSIVRNSTVGDMARALGEEAEGVRLMRAEEEEGRLRNRAVPRAPFVGKTDAWVALAIKRVVKMAVDEGYDRVAFISGEQSAERFDLSKQISQVKYEKTDSGGYEIEAYSADGGSCVLHEGEDEKGVPISRVEELVGKELARKIANGDGVADNGGGYRNWRSLRGLELKVGGEGMKAFYDRIVPSVVKDVVRKLGGYGVGSVDVKTGESTHIPLMGIGFDHATGQRYLSKFGGDERVDLRNFASYAEADAAREKMASDAEAGISGQLGFDITAKMREVAADGVPMFRRTEEAKVEQTETPEFKAWFGDSKLLDDVGEPQRLYHATASDFSEFKPGGPAASLSGPAIWLSPHADHQAAMHNIATRGGFRDGTNVMPVYARLERPLRIDDKGMLDWARSVFADDSKEFPQLMSAKTVREIQAEGYDGIIFDGNALGWGQGNGERANEVIVFAPEQIKSAIGNNGAFDPTNADIRFRRAKAQIETPEFKAWFSKSRVVDPEGRPKVVYHGTNASEPIANFAGSAYAGWFAEDPSKANAYTSSSSGDGGEDGAIYPAHLSIEHPLDLSSLNADDEFDPNALARLMGVDTNELQELFDDHATGPAYWNLIDSAFFREWVEALDMDGIKVREGDVITWAAIRPEQIKSAIGNVGTFDPNNADIRFRRPQGSRQAAQAEAVASRVAELQGQVDAIASAMTNAPRIRVVGSIDDKAVPNAIRAEDAKQRSIGKGGITDGVFYRGTAYLFANQLRTYKDLVRVVFHEVLGHAGLRGAFGNRLDGVLDQVAEWSPKLLQEKAKLYQLDLGKPAERRAAAEEVLASMAEERPELPFAKRAGAAIRTFARDHIPGYESLALTDNEVVRSFILPARRWIERGGKPATLDAAPFFSRKAIKPFYSALMRQVSTAAMRSAPADGWKQWLTGLVGKGQVKADELQWSGMSEWLDLQQGKVSRQALQDFLDQNGVEVTETVLGVADSTAHFVEREDTAAGPIFRVASKREDGETVFFGRSHGSEGMAQRAADVLNGLEPTKYPRYQLPGGANYREVLLTLPSKSPRDAAEAALEVFRQKVRSRLGKESFDYDDMSPAEDAEHERLNAAAMKADAKPASGYKSGHWDQHPNVVAHIRLNDRTDADGKRVLFVEEIQSDWAQRGKKEGFAEAGKGWAAKKDESGRWDVSNDGEYQSTVDAGSEDAAISMMLGQRTGIPNGPFVGKTDAWVALAIKRVIKMAVDEGYDRVAFISGEQSADRYDLGKQIEAVRYTKLGDDQWGIAATLFGRFGGGEERDIGHYTRATLPDAVGKDVAEKIIRGEGRVFSGTATLLESRELRGLDLKVGGEGMKAFYDKIVPSVAKDILKKLGGGQLGQAKFPNPSYAEMQAQLESEVPGTPAFNFVKQARDAVLPITQLSFDITDKMREMAADGVPMFSRQAGGGGVRSTEPASTGVDAAASSDRSAVASTARAWRRLAGGLDSALQALRERFVVLDKRERAFSWVVDGDTMKPKLEPMSPHEHKEVRLDADRAAQVVGLLEAGVPEYGPFRIADYKEVVLEHAKRFELLAEAEALAAPIVPEFAFEDMPSPIRGALETEGLADASPSL